MTDSGYKSSLKREASDDMGDNDGPSKRPRGGRSVDVRFLVPSKNAGAIIGKGGSHINRLRTDFSASVTVPDCPGPERILAIGADLDALGDILLDILPKFDDYSQHNDLDFDCELRMLLHQSHAGCLIGKGGSRIKELREKTGSQVKIFSNCCPNSTERIVQITGTPNVVVDCVKEICNIVSTAPIKGPNKQYDPLHFNPMFCNDYGGYEETGNRGRGRGGFRGGSFGGDRGGRGFGNSYGGRGRGGGMMGQAPNSGNRWSNFGGNSGGGGNLGGWVTEQAANAGYGGNRMMGPMNGQNSNNFMPPGDKNLPPMGGPSRLMMNMGGGGGFQGGAPGHNMNGPPSRFMGPPRPQKLGIVSPIPNTGELFQSKPVSMQNGSFSIVMKIPNDVAGAIIGKGGQRIRKIRRDSAANINIEEASQGTNERIITIGGTLNQAQMAQFLMQQSVRESNQGGGGGGMGGRRF